MKIRLHPPLGIHDQGRRENNEDSIYPKAEDGFATDKDRLFLVCDGVGGLEKGEVASKIVSETLAEVLSHQAIIKKEEIDAAIRLAEQKIDQYIKGNLEAQGMATTLTLLALHEQGATIAHIGDSRVYQIRNGQCIFKTRDHSLINDLIAKDIITAEEALNHPKRNVITKAISGFSNYQQASVKFITDIQDGDYFFLCTDGVQESFTDEELLHLLAAKFSNVDKIKFIETKCKKDSKDNFSAYLIQIKRAGEDGAIAPFLNWEILKSGKYSKTWVTMLAVVSGISIVLLINSISTKKAKELEQVNIESALEMLQDIDTLEIAPMSNEVLNLEEKQSPSPSKKEAVPPKKLPSPKDSILEEYLELEDYGYEGTNGSAKQNNY